jgi:hypothetical protein
MSEYQNTIIAIAKIKEQQLSLLDTYKLFKTLPIPEYLIDDITLNDDMFDFEIVEDYDINSSELQIMENPYQSEVSTLNNFSWKTKSGRLRYRGDLYLFMELPKFPKTSQEMQLIEIDFLKYKDLIYIETFEIKNINWYNGADMPLFND